MQALQWIMGMFSRLGDLNPRQLLAIFAVSGLCMFGLMYAALTNIKEVEQVDKSMPAMPAVKTRSVVIAKTDITPQTLLKRDMLEMREFPESMVPENAAVDMSTVLNRSVKTEIFAGDVITSQKLYGESEAAGFIGAIPKDCRAVSVSINDITGVAGFAKPGDHVDVILVEKDGNMATSTIILQNSLLLSINGNMGVKQSPTEEMTTDPATQPISNPSIATLALRPDEVLRLISASKLGEIYLMLRPLKPLDTYVDDEGYTFRGYKAPTAPRVSESKPVEQRPAEQRAPTSTVITPEPAPALEPPSKTEEAKPEPESKPEPRKFEIIYGDE